MLTSAASGQTYIQLTPNAGIHRTKITSITPIKLHKELLVSDKFASTPGVLTDVSHCEKFAVFCHWTLDTAEVMGTRRADKSLFAWCSYKPAQGKPSDARFCFIQGREMLLVVTINSGEHRKVHVFDYLQKRLACYLDEEFSLTSPWGLQTDFYDRLLIGCHKGQIVSVNLKQCQLRW
jgi:hypothetical protein